MKGFVCLADQSFDIPDRTFHSMNTTWRLSSYESMTDVKELIPEFFYLPEFLVNREGGALLLLVFLASSSIQPFIIPNSILFFSGLCFNG